MSSALRGLYISVISTSLICSPLYSLNANASKRGKSQRNHNASRKQLSDHEADTLLVKFNAETPEQIQRFIIDSVSHSHRHLRGQSEVIKLRLKESLDFSKALDALREFDNVIEWIEPNYTVKRAGDARHTGSSRTLGLRKAKTRMKEELPAAIVAVIDTGIDPNHRALKDSLWTDTDDSRGWKFITDDDQVADDNGHGTQVAGIIAKFAIHNSRMPIRLLPLKALDHTGAGTIAEVVEAIDYAVARHAAVINCSFGATAYSRAMLDAIKRAETAGILVVAAAGNHGQDISKSSFYPASYRQPNLISVAAVDEHNLLVPFSNFSADIAAPGTNIRTAHPNNSYVRLSGTSAAAGFVSAAAGLLKSKRGWVSAQTIREAILKSANQSSNPFGDLKDKVSSRGIVNPEGALSLLLRDSKDSKSNAPATNRRITPAIKAALQSGNGNLDAMRNSQPNAPNAYQQTGTLPSPSYDDPKPANMANYNSIMTKLAASDKGIAGSKPLQSVDPTAGTASVGGWSYNLGSRNYNFTLPVLGLPGRAGLGLGLGLSYNSNVWLYDSANNTYVFNADRGFPAPGWRIGFGMIQVKNNTEGVYLNSTTGKNSIVYIAPDGTQHDLAYNSTTSRFESYDSSYIAFDSNQQILYFPNGTTAKFQFGSSSNSYDPIVRDFQQYPIEIKDRNGNFITLSYKTISTQKVVIDYVIDTAGRRIDFNYQNNKLVSVSQNRNGSTFTYVYLDYQPVTLNTYFPGGAAVDPNPINGAQVYFPSRITFPTGINYRFNYNSYGVINTIDKWVPTIPGQGNERKIATTGVSLDSYDPNNPIPYSPNFLFRYESAENWQGASYNYYYDLGGTGSHEIQAPTRRFGVSRNGMILSMIDYDSGHNRIKQDDATYISDSGPSYTSNPRVSQAKTMAWVGANVNIKYSNYSYVQRDGMWLVENKDDYNGNPNLLYRRTTTTYTSIPSQYILGLPQQVSVYNATNTLLSRVTNNYDQPNGYTDSNGQNQLYLMDETGAGVIQHNTSYNFGFTSRGNLTSVVQSSVASGAVNGTRTIKYLSYDTNGNLRAEADGAGNRKQIVYNDNYSNKPGTVGQTQVQAYSVADPTGFRMGSQWNYYTGQTLKTFNMVTPGSSTESQIVMTDYDPLTDRPLLTTRPDGGWVRTNYWDNWLATVTSQLVETSKVRFKFVQADGAGRIYRNASDHPDGIAGKYSGQITVFDQTGQTEDSSSVIAINSLWAPVVEDPINDPNPFFRFTHMTRDDLSRLKILTFPDNNIRQYDFTGCGCAGNSETRVTDELGHFTTTKTDFLGRLVEAVEPDYVFGDYSKAQYFYDELDRLTEIRHSNGLGDKNQSRYFVYDGYGRLQIENTPEGGVVNYTYTANDLPQTVANQRNITVTNSYNTRNLLTGVSYSDTTPAVSFGYDTYGARNSMTDGEGQTTYSYNSFRQLQSETRAFTGLPGKSFVLSYIYNLADQLKSVNYNFIGGSFNKNVNYAYNTVGALASVGTNIIGSDPNATTNVISALSFRGSGAIKTINYGNGRKLAMGYNANRQQPVSMRVDMANNPNDKIIDYAYEYYDANGNNNNRIRRITDNVDSPYTVDYTYDGYNRLISAIASAYTRVYGYDQWGNITNFNGVTLNYATNGSGAPATNRLASDSGGFNYTYDAAGNQTNAPGYTYEFDGANRLKAVNGSSATYGYDGDGMKARQTTGGNAIYYVRSSVLKAVVIEANAAGVYRAYVYAANKLVAQQSYDGQFYWIHTDHLGSGHKMTDSAGVVKYRSEYDSYGQAVLSWAASGDVNINSKRFTGYERDMASGLDYANARMYNSGRGKFIQPDPLGSKNAKSRSPQSLNRYAYTGNDPVNFVDPGGLISLKIEDWELDWLCSIGIIAACRSNETVPQRLPVLPQDKPQKPAPKVIDPLSLLPDYGDALKYFKEFLENNPGCENAINKAGEAAGIKENFVDTFSNITWADARNASNAVLRRPLGDFGETGRSRGESLDSAFKVGQAISIWTRTTPAGQPDPVVLIGPNFGQIGNQPLLTAHEVLHIQFKDDHVGLANKLGLGDFKNDDKGNKAASDAINAYLNNNCGQPRK